MYKNINYVYDGNFYMNSISFYRAVFCAALCTWRYRVVYSCSTACRRISSSFFKYKENFDENKRSGYYISWWLLLKQIVATPFLTHVALQRSEIEKKNLNKFFATKSKNSPFRNRISQLEKSKKILAYFLINWNFILCRLVHNGSAWNIL